MIKLSTFIGFFLISIIPALSQDFIEVAEAQGILPGGCGDCNEGGGVSFADFNGDGLDDITFGTESGEPMLFYQNNGSSFDLLNPAPVSITDETKQILWNDIDNDGDKDLFVCNYNAPNRLFENEGNLVMSEITTLAGLPINNNPTYSASFGDYNNDGFLDLFVTEWGESFNLRNRLYRNNGNNTFIDVNNDTGVGQNSNLTLATAFLDINNNGLQDIYNSSDRYQDVSEMLKNTCDQIFEDISSSSNTDVMINSMCVTVGDYDNDGDSDIYVTNSEQGNLLLRNNGDETFTNVASTFGVEVNKFTWGSNFFDCDNDMDLDLYVSQSHASLQDVFTRTLYINDIPNGNFYEAEAPGMEGDSLHSFSNAIGDFNNDGRPDIVVNNANPSINDDFDFHLWQNTTENFNNWIKVFLVGTESNRDGIGSWIEIYVNGNKYVRYRHSGIGYLAQNSSAELIGLGPNTMIDSIKVRWLSSNVDVLYNVSANQFLTIAETPTGAPFQCGCDYTPPATANDAEICQGDDLPELMASVGNGMTVDWYDAPVGGNLLLEGSITFTPSSLGTYYAEARDPETDCFSNTRAAVSIIVYDTPIAEAGEDQSVCLGQMAMFTATVSGGDGNFSYEWNSGAGTNQSFSVSPNSTTTYSLEVTDGNGCSSTDEVTAIVFPFPLVIAGVDTTICQNECHSLSFNISGGTAPYSHIWSGNGDTLVCPLVTTNYSVTVTDNNNCSSSDVTKVTVASLPIIDIGDDLSLCLGDCNTFDPEISEGTEPYSLTWSGDNAESVCPDNSGNYMVTIYDGNECSSSDTVNITVNLPLPAIELDTSICPGTCITISAADYNLSSFEIDGNSLPNATICETGSHEFEVNDLNGCSTLLTLELDFIQAPIADAGEDMVINCFQPIVNIGGPGTTIGPNLVYLWSNGVTSPTQQILQEGTYDFSVVDMSTGCVSSPDTVIITTDLESPTIITGDDIELTCATPTASLSGVGSSSGADFSYEWSTPDGNIVDGTTTLNPIVDSEGTYLLTVTNSNNGCTSSASQIVTKAGMPEITVESLTDILCFGDQTGAIDISVSGGLEDYTYEWSNGAETEDISGIPAGEYEVTVTDGNGCEVSMSATVETPGVIQIQFSVTDESASGANNGIISTTIAGGIADYSFEWNTGSSESDLTALAPGWYYLTLTDTNNCMAMDSTYVNNFECGTLAAESSGIMSICPGSSGGSITINEISGGEGPYTLLWSNGETTSTVENLQGGLYACSVSDDNNCNLILNFEIIEEDNIPPTLVIQDVSIYLDENGTATLSPEMIDAGSSDNCSEVNFIIENSTFDCPETGIYAIPVILSDESNLYDTAIVNVTIFDTIAPVFTNCPSDIITENCLSVEYQLPVANDNCEGLTYELTDGMISGSTFPVGTTVVSYLVTDEADNTADCTFNITVESSLSVSVQTSPFNCDSILTYSATLTPQGGTPDYTYAWNDGTTTPENLISLEGPWSWTVTDSQGCNFQGDFTIEIPDVIEAILVTSPETDTESNGGIEAIISGGQSPYTFEWSNSTGTIVANTEDLNDVPTDIYCLLITDFNGCTLTQCDTVDQITHTIDEKLSSEISIAPNPSSGKISVGFEMTDQKEATLILLDINGKLLLRTRKGNTAKKVEIDLSEFSDGIYLMKIIVGNRMVIKKVLINK
jgi:hypothetical protein